MDFFYPNYINDMWRIYGLLFFQNRDYFVDVENRVFKREMIISFLQEKGIALYDTASAVVRTTHTAADKDLEVYTPTALDDLLRRIPQCTHVVTTGQLATEVFTTHYQMRQPKIGQREPFKLDGRSLFLYRMPSSSRAYPMKLEQKAEYYRQMLLDIGILREE